MMMMMVSLVLSVKCRLKPSSLKRIAFVDYTGCHHLGRNLGLRF